MIDSDDSLSVDRQQLRALDPHSNSVTSGTNTFDMSALLEQLNTMNTTPGVVTVRSGDRGEFATLRFGLQHFVAEASKFKIKEVSLTRTQDLSNCIKKIKYYLSAAEKQIGSENVEQLRIPFFREVLGGTSLEYFAEDPESTWRELLTNICELFEIQEDDEIELFNSMMLISPNDSVTIKQCLIKILGIWQKANIDQAVGILPPVAVMVRKIINWFPPTSKAIIPESLFEVNHVTTWQDAIPFIRSLTCVTPIELRAMRAKEIIKPKVSSSPYVSAKELPVKPGKIEFKSDARNERSGVSKTQKPQEKPKKLGRLIRNSASTEIEFRIDTGADDHCFGKDLIPYIENRKPTQGSYQVLLTSKDVKVEEGQLLVSAQNNKTSKLLKLKGIINAANNMSVLSTTTCSIVNGKGSFQLPGSVASFPCYSRDGFAYCTFRIVGSGKSYESISSLLGFTTIPKATPEDFVFACHLKFGCAGVDSLCDTMAILGYAIRRNLVYSVLASCDRCVSKTFFKGPVMTDNDSVSAKKPSEEKISISSNPGLVSLLAPTKNKLPLTMIPAKRPKLIESEKATNTTYFLDSFLFGAVDSVFDNESLVFDHAVLKSSYLLCTKLEKRGMYFVDVCKAKSDLDLVLRVLTTFKDVIKHVRCDKAKEFLTVEKKCKELGIEFVSSTLGRDQFKGRHEATVKVVKTMFAQVVDRISHTNPEYAWHPKLSSIATSFLLNTRASPSRKSIPWFTTFEKRPRYDLHLFQPVFVVTSSKIIPGVEKGETGLFIGQTNPTHGWYIPFKGDKLLEAKEADISAFRQAKINPVDFIKNFDSKINFHIYDDPKFFGALSTTARTLSHQERKGQEWKSAIEDHCQKLLKYKAFSKSPGASTNWGNAFFVGRLMDGAYKARLVCNGALTSDVPLDSSLPGIEERRLFFILISGKIKEGWKVYSGDISGAYYNTPGSGCLKLPHNWPAGLGDYFPNEIVNLNCAIPGDSLSSGLFLAKLSSLLTEHGYEVLSGTIRSSLDTILLNYSDDLMIAAKDDKAIRKLNSVLNSQFSVDLEPGLPKRWVSCEFTNDGGKLLVSLSGTAASFNPDSVKFTLASDILI